MPRVAAVGGSVRRWIALADAIEPVALLEAEAIAGTAIGKIRREVDAHPLAGSRRGPTPRAAEEAGVRCARRSPCRPLAAPADHDGSEVGTLPLSVVGKTWMPLAADSLLA